MEGISINKTSSLSSSDIDEFLAEIEDADDELKQAEQEAKKAMALDAELDDFEEAPVPTDAELEAMYDGWTDENNYKGHSLQKQEPSKIEVANFDANKQKATAERARIKRLAVEQTVIPLSDKITAENKRILISALTERHTDMIDKHKTFINNRITALLRPLVPGLLLQCEQLYHDSIRRSPGFLYRASKEYGKGLTFWAEPSVPYFYAQGTETDIIRAMGAQYTAMLDISVALYHEYIAKREEKELKCASKLYILRIRTYLDLLKANPFWFNKLYTALTKDED